MVSPSGKKNERSNHQYKKKDGGKNGSKAPRSFKARREGRKKAVKGKNARRRQKGKKGKKNPSVKGGETTPGTMGEVAYEK